MSQTIPNGSCLCGAVNNEVTGEPKARIFAGSRTSSSPPRSPRCRSRSSSPSTPAEKSLVSWQVYHPKRGESLLAIVPVVPTNGEAKAAVRVSDL